MEMIKTLVFVRKKPGMSFEDFARYWVDIHGPIAAKLPGLRRLVTNLVRPELQRAASRWDGLSCAWFESAEAVRSVASTPQFHAMLDDEENFVDTSDRFPIIIAPHFPLPESTLVADGSSDTIKTVVAIWRKSGTECEAFNSYWKNTHSKLICALPNLQAYVQNTVRMDMQRREPPCDAMAECWWTNLGGVREAVKSAAYAAVQADEKQFVDADRLAPMMVREVEVVRDGELLRGSKFTA
jgi:uncharacterized protein (TIGR02118 family)